MKFFGSYFDLAKMKSLFCLIYSVSCMWYRPTSPSWKSAIHPLSFNPIHKKKIYIYIYIYWNLTWNFPSIRCPKNPLWCYIYIYIYGLCGCSNPMSSSIEWENSVGSNQKKTWVLSHSKLGRQSTHSEEDRA